MREAGENDHGVTANSKKKITSQVSIYSELKVTSELRDTRQGHLTPWRGSSSCLCPAASPQPPRSLLRARGSCAEAVGRRSSSSLAFSEAPEVHTRLHHPDSATCAFSPHGLCMGWELTGKAPTVDRVRHRQYRTLNSSHAGGRGRAGERRVLQGSSKRGARAPAWRSGESRAGPAGLPPDSSAPVLGSPRGTAVQRPGVHSLNQTPVSNGRGKDGGKGGRRRWAGTGVQGFDKVVPGGQFKRALT